MTNIQGAETWFESGRRVQRTSDGISDNARRRQKEPPLHRCKPSDPTTATAMRLAELRAEGRAAIGRGDIASMIQIELIIARDLVE